MESANASSDEDAGKPRRPFADFDAGEINQLADPQPPPGYSISPAFAEISDVPAAPSRERESNAHRHPVVGPCVHLRRIHRVRIDTMRRMRNDQRPAAGAALHAKVVVIDDTTALISSANLIRRAAGDNLEAGLLVRGGDVPQRIVGHVNQLLQQQILRKDGPGPDSC